MPDNEVPHPRALTWKVGAEQGQGVESTGTMMARVLNRMGYYVYAYRLFSSRIKGGHSNYAIRISNEPVRAPSHEDNILVALDQETIDRNHMLLAPGGLILADSDFGPKLPEGCTAELLVVPFSEIASSEGQKIMRNVAALGASAYLMGIPLTEFEVALKRQFERKGEKVWGANIAVLHKAYEYVREHHPLQNGLQLPQPYSDAANGAGKTAPLFLTGNEALALGALAAGCRIMAGYPITPASEILSYMERYLPAVGGAAVQTEDEMAAVMIAVAAGYAGVRAMTATSGPGLSLMQEILGLAHICEIPFVLVDCQRGGPSTGMPTKQEQSDLWALLYGTHGDTQRILLAPGNAEEAFYDAQLAFNLAERHQCPVIVAMDLSLSLDETTVRYLDKDRIPIDRGLIATPEDLKHEGHPRFPRYLLTESGISPRSIPGQEGGQYLATGAEHGIYGWVNENPQNRVAMVDKRARKVRQIDAQAIIYEGPADPDILMIGWGSPRGAISEAAAALRREGIQAAVAHMRVLAPFPSKELAEYVSRAKRVLVVEQNANGQLQSLIEAALFRENADGRRTYPRIEHFRKYNGVSIFPVEIIAVVKESVEHGSQRQAI